MLGFGDGMDRGEQTGYLPQGAELEHRVVESRLPIDEDAAELDGDRQPKREWHRHGPHGWRHRPVGVDHHLGLARLEAGDLVCLLEALGRPDPRHLPFGGRQGEPNPLAIEASD